MHFSSRLFSSIALLAVFVALPPSVTLAKDSGIAITRVIAGWRDAASFKRIAEYFSGHENMGGTAVLRTHPDQRAGFYFLVSAENPGPPVTMKINLTLITPTDNQPKTYTFATGLKSGKSALNLGLTANDWPDTKANPVAWKIDFVNDGGLVFASEKSYLWERPTTK